MRILCVEDEPGLRRSLLRLLQFSGHDPVGVESSEAALVELERGSFDLVISDVRLPGRDGDWLCREIQTRYPPLGRRVVLMSGFFCEERNSRVFLQKPFSLQQLRAAIEAVLQ